MTDTNGQSFGPVSLAVGASATLARCARSSTPSSRPWKIAGEGPTQGAGGSLYAGPGRQYVAGDMRFTTKADALYAIALGWPEDRRLVIKSLASNSPHYRGEIARIGLLGSESNLVWSRNADGVTINLPEKPPCDYAYVFKINPLGA